MMNTLELPSIVHLIFFFQKKKNAVGFFSILDCREKIPQGKLKLGIEA